MKLTLCSMGITFILLEREYFNIHKVYNFPFRYQHEAEFNKMR